MSLSQHNQDRDRRVKVLVNGVAVSDSLAQSVYSKYLNFNGNDFTVITNDTLKAFDVSLKTIAIGEKETSATTGSIIWNNTPNSVNVGTGILNNISQDRIGATSIPVADVDIDGMHIRLVTDDDPTTTDCNGYSTSSNFAMSEHSPRFWGKIKILTALAGKRVFIGYSATAVPKGVDDMLGSGLAGFGLRYLGGTNWDLHTNNNVGTSGGTTSVAAALNTVLTYDIKLNWNNGTPQIDWFINGVAQPTFVSTNLPPAGTKMRFTIRIETTTTSAQSINSYYQHVKCDK